MLILAGAALGLLAGLAAGGSLAALTFPRLHVRWPVAPMLAVLVKELGLLGPLGHSSIQPFLYLAALLVLLGWVLWHLWELRGSWLVAVGVSLNVLVVAANAGRMPVAAAVAPWAPEQLAGQGALGQYVIAGVGTRIGWLGDWVVLPGVLGSVFSQVYSPGDLVVATGLAVVLFLAVRPPRVAGGRRTRAEVIRAGLIRSGGRVAVYGVTRWRIPRRSRARSGSPTVGGLPTTTSGPRMAFPSSTSTRSPRPAGSVTRTTPPPQPRVSG
jgi:hypothetical protein